MTVLVPLALANSTRSPLKDMTSTSLPSLEDLPDHGDPLFSREQGRFFGIFEDGDEDPVEDVEPPVDDVDVAVRDRIERARIDSRVSPSKDSILVPPSKLTS